METEGEGIEEVPELRNYNRNPLEYFREGEYGLEDLKIGFESLYNETKSVIGYFIGGNLPGEVQKGFKDPEGWKEKFVNFKGGDYDFEKAAGISLVVDALLFAGAVHTILPDKDAPFYKYMVDYVAFFGEAGIDGAFKTLLSYHRRRDSMIHGAGYGEEVKEPVGHPVVELPYSGGKLAKKALDEFWNDLVGSKGER